MKRSIRDLDIKDKRVIIRCDFNVPLKDDEIIDDTRIIESLETIKYAIDQGAKVILMSHLGRIKSIGDLGKYNLEPVAKRLSELLNLRVRFSNRTRGEDLEEMVNKLNPGEVLLIQNTRYEDLEEKLESSNNEELASYWASLGEIFINDAFGTLHRAHASNVGIASRIPNAIGLLVEKELQALSILDKPKKPYVLILGGSKIEDKIGVIEVLGKKCDEILIGGGMAFTFLKALGKNVGDSIVDDERLEFCSEILKKYKKKIHLPVDVLASTEIDAKVASRITSLSGIRVNEKGLDIGIESIANFKEQLKDAQTVIWNGPLGVYEIAKYANATNEILKFLVENNIDTVLGGGDVVAAATKLGFKDKITHASTGGGATLEYLEGKVLPGLDIIENK